jgi:splicing factor U2AF subunit
VYHNPAHDPVCKLTEAELQEGFDAVYEDLYCELAKFGHLLELHVSNHPQSITWHFTSIRFATTSVTI